ncbi:MAG: HAD-IA family hydrolase, partial [Pseudomonadota bacterium]
MSTSLQNCVVIFDLDGTLVDSAPDLTAALNHVLQAEGLGPIPLAEMRPMVGHGAAALLKAAYQYYGMPSPEGEKHEHHLSLFKAYYQDHLTDHSRPFEGAVACLEKLKSAGASLAVCTNKVEKFSLPLLQDLGLDHWFSEVICRDSLEEYKPSGLPLLTILNRVGCTNGIMVGDTTTDLYAARAANT